MTTVIAVIGWTAAGALLLGYRLVTSGRVGGASLTYLAVNMFGSAGLGLSTAAAHSWPSAANNAIWLVMGIGPLVHALRIHRGRHREPMALAAGGALRLDADLYGEIDAAPADAMQIMGSGAGA